jgi:hypothetical protein
MDVADIAMICHEANRALCLIDHDFSQPTWANAPEWQQESAINGVQFHLENPDATPSGSHENWYREREADGWTYGKVKNVTEKKHPCMVPFEHLPQIQQAKDHLFKAIVNSLARFVTAEKEAA